MSMDSLRSLLIQNQTNLDRLRARARYLFVHISNSNFDTHKQFGPYADFWEDWHDHATSLLSEVKADILATKEFCDELRDFIIFNESGEKVVTVRTQKKQIKEMTELAEEAIVCQNDMLKMANLRISEHQEFTNKLLLVEAIDSLNED